MRLLLRLGKEQYAPKKAPFGWPKGHKWRLGNRRRIAHTAFPKRRRRVEQYAPFVSLRRLGKEQYAPTKTT